MFISKKAEYDSQPFLCLMAIGVSKYCLITRLTLLALDG